MNCNLYITDPGFRLKFKSAWPEFAELVVDDFSELTHRHTVILRDNVEVLDVKFFHQIQSLIDANNYLDALKHDAWMVFGNEYVKLNLNRDYWHLNLRPVVGFDNSTWRFL